MKKTIATFATGGALVEVGAQAAGFEPIWGIEIIDEIAQVARDNGLHVVTADITKVNPNDFERPYAFHASLPCLEFSQAKKGGKETSLDILMAQATVRFIETLEPKLVTLENVSMYRFSQSWRLIQNALDRLGYWMDVQNHLNMADFGVPQTRKRMIVRAIRGGFLPPLPAPVPWRGWYQAIEDLIPDLPDSEFAPWQLERGVQDLLDQTCLLSQGSFDHTDEGNNREAQPIGKRAGAEPAYTVTSNVSMLGMRAFIVSGQSGDNGKRLTIRCADEPSFVISSSEGKRPVRAFIVDSCNAGQPSPTIREANEPTFTVVANSADKGMPRAAVPRRTVQMIPRALARFQSIPDDYALPDSATLAVRIIGNAVPPLFYRQLVEPFV